MWEQFLYFYRLQWNDLVKAFRTGMPLQRHRKALRRYDNCFMSSDAINWFHLHLRSSPDFEVAITRFLFSIISSVTLCSCGGLSLEHRLNYCSRNFMMPRSLKKLTKTGLDFSVATDFTGKWFICLSFHNVIKIKNDLGFRSSNNLNLNLNDYFKNLKHFALCVHFSKMWLN